MLNFSSEVITFPFVQNNHLKTTLILANDSSKHVYFKFRVSKPRPYLVKPPQGYIKPQSSVSIAFTLQKDQINQAVGDKFMLLYVGTDTPKQENYSQLFVGDYETKKFPIKITGIQLNNLGINQAIANVGQQIFTSVNRQPVGQQFSSPIQMIASNIKANKQDRVKQLQKQIDQYRRSVQISGKNVYKSITKQKSSNLNLIISLTLGLLVGYFLLPYLK